MKIDNFEDLRRYVSGQIEGVDMNCYLGDFNQLVEDSTDRLYDHLVERYGFKFGHELPNYKVSIFKLMEDLER